MRTGSRDPVVVLESFGNAPHQRSFTFTGFEEVIVASSVEDVVPALGRVQTAVDNGLHAAGYISYEAAPGLDAAMVTHPPRDGFPLVWFALYRNREETDAKGRHSEEGPKEWAFSLSREVYQDRINRIHALIRAGDTYQVNFTFRLRSVFRDDPRGFYEGLSSAQRADYGAFLDTGRYQILSASPELFFAMKDGEIRTRPMKGTRPRGLWTGDDERLVDELATSEKDRAENLMIVDLLRNDLGRVCETGSIQVENLWSVERYETVLQMTSEVRGRLKTDCDFEDVVRALFPCGSVTGAPKIRTMEIIRDLECSPRGGYTGAIGYVSPGGEAAFSVAIRTVCVDSETETAEYGVGSGITHDSDHDHEYAECVTKAHVLTERRPEFDLFETLRFDPGEGVFLLERHLDRMAGSARYFRFPFDRTGAMAAIGAAIHGATGTLRFRLDLSRSGHFSWTHQTLTRSNGMTAVVSEYPVHSTNPFLYHKTTHRAVYEDQIERYRDDAQMVIMVNERNELADCLVGNLVLEMDGCLLTPPVSSGLLAGTYRAELLEEGRIVERVLGAEDVDRAEGVYMINSVREWVPLDIVGRMAQRELNINH